MSGETKPSLPQEIRDIVDEVIEDRADRYPELKHDQVRREVRTEMLASGKKVVDVWSEIERLSDEDDADFRVLATDESADAARPLLIVVHPGDAVQKRADVQHSSDPEGILAYSRSCQEAMGSELSRLDYDKWNVVLIHRFSSSYSFANDNDLDFTFSDEIGDLDGDSATILWGDDLKAAAQYLITELKASERPLVVVTGAWSDADWGCVTTVGRQLEAAGAPVRLSTSACISPDGSGVEWMPKAGRIDTDEILAFETSPAPVMST